MPPLFMSAKSMPGAAARCASAMRLPRAYSPLPLGRESRSTATAVRESFSTSGRERATIAGTPGSLALSAQTVSPRAPPPPPDPPPPTPPAAPPPPPPGPAPVVLAHQVGHAVGGAVAPCLDD